jgi:hypothetical protein
VLTKRPLGVSGKLARVVFWQETRDLERVAAEAEANPEAFDDAMLEATLEMIRTQMGEEAAAEYRAKAEAERAASCTATAPDPPCTDADPKRVPLEVHLAFMLGILGGGLAAALGSGSFSLRYSLDPAFAQLVAAGPGGLATLFGGGVLVGVGTAMAGGCTSGHGLTGCARFQPGSLVATAAFFGTASLVSAWLAGGFGGAL